MKKRIEYKIEDNDLDKVSGGGASWDGAFRAEKQYINPYSCQHCGFIMGERENVKDGDECPACNGIQKIYHNPDYNPDENGQWRII